MEKDAQSCPAEHFAELGLQRDHASSVTQREVTQQDWLYGAVRILASRPVGLHIEQLERLLWQLHYPGIAMPGPFRIQLQSILGRYSSQSVVFRQRRTRSADDLFFSPEGKGSGTWAVRRANAEAWLIRQRHPAARPRLQSAR